MCGIAGVYALTTRMDVSSVITRMTRDVAHRGPDGEGISVCGPVALGHRRLAIIDLTDFGRQPMASADGRYEIVYNGETYNYIEIREELIALGHRFRSRTDTEVVLAAFAQWGRESLKRLNGMFAFIIADTVTGQIYAARDRFGIKPLYYVNTPEALALGSEIRQLLRFLPRVAANALQVADFLMTSSADAPSDTFFAGVSKVPAGCYLEFRRGMQEPKITRWYDLAKAVDAEPPCTTLDEFSTLLEDSVRLRLRADVRVGTCLSGGLDSSTVATLAADKYSKASGRPFGAITAISEDVRNDESGFAGSVANAAGLEWIQTRPTYDLFAGTIRDIITAQEEPFGTPSIVMQYHVMRTASEKGIPVLLDGQGGDETLLGYEYAYLPFLRTLARQGSYGRMLAEVRAARLHNANMRAKAFAFHALKSFFPGLRAHYLSRRHRYLRIERRSRWLEASRGSLADVRRHHLAEVLTASLPALLRFEDKSAMHFAIETRLPFLDYRIVQHAIALPPNLKIQRGWSKWPLRATMSGRMPDDVVWRTRKLGFEAPEAIWLRRHEVSMREAVRRSDFLATIADHRKMLAAFDTFDLRSRFRLFLTALWADVFGVAA